MKSTLGRSQVDSRIEKMINSSLDDIVRQSKRSRRLQSNRQHRNSLTPKKAVAKPNTSKRHNIKGGGNIQILQKGSNFKNSQYNKGNGGNKRLRQLRDRDKVIIRRKQDELIDKTKLTSGDIRNIKIVAQLDKLPAPTAQQKAGVNNLDVIPSSISSHRIRQSKPIGKKMRL
ncbi:uncharacterized protein CMU_014830 [Cryptosporidium muris RN66]|uniref:Uncharacterized protein n=1 Tax=Cryptosporidium muris (strain RN66) TaxID=441375 RepID=B6AF40_CRYMR|nr:uncharacterized protein CMU_014830 [Cryptosporidium muris RN66]EEA06807.1 hypothetical protein, conserved [Cryptosporidium muris RN66]|eukprot:XP_002141156.1 hypothetical protein [Cryptosporidium muris RN66]